MLGQTEPSSRLPRLSLNTSQHSFVNAAKLEMAYTHYAFRMLCRHKTFLTSIMTLGQRLLRLATRACVVTPRLQRHSYHPSQRVAQLALKRNELLWVKMQTEVFNGSIKNM